MTDTRRILSEPMNFHIMKPPVMTSAKIRKKAKKNVFFFVLWQIWSGIGHRLDDREVGGFFFIFFFLSCSFAATDRVVYGLRNRFWNQSATSGARQV